MHSRWAGRHCGGVDGATTYMRLPRPCVLTGALGAEPDRPLTSMGALLASLPLDVGVGKILVLATFTGLLEEALVLAALLSVQSPFKCVPPPRRGWVSMCASAEPHAVTPHAGRG